MMSDRHHYLYYAILFILINIKVLAFSYQLPPHYPFCGIQWHSGILPLMAVNGGALVERLMAEAFAIQREKRAIAIQRPVESDCHSLPFYAIVPLLASRFPPLEIPTKRDNCYLFHKSRKVFVNLLVISKGNSNFAKFVCV